MTTFSARAVSLVAAILVLVVASAAAAQTLGGDVYRSGSSPSLSSGAGRDAFVAGFSASIDAEVASDAHIAGFDIDVDGPVRGDLYATGASVTVSAPVGDDLTAAGFSVRIGREARVGGNARIVAGTVEIDGPVEGSLAASAGNLELDARVGGDASLTGANISFGSNARIDGRLTYYAEEEIDIPASVIPAERVRFVPSDVEALDDLREIADEQVRSFWPSFLNTLSAFIVTLVFLLVIAALFIAFAPRITETSRQQALAMPGRGLVAGFLALAMLVGLIPVSAITIIGIPLIPVVLLFMIVAWILAYLLGAYALSTRVYAGFSAPAETNATRIVVLAVGLIVLAILNYVPFLGWLVNLAVVLFGLGTLFIMVGRPMFGAVVADPKNAPLEASRDADSGRN